MAEGVDRRSFVICRILCPGRGVQLETGTALEEGDEADMIEMGMQISSFPVFVCRCRSPNLSGDKAVAHPPLMINELFLPSEDRFPILRAPGTRGFHGSCPHCGLIASPPFYFP
jgi:hypothetical protein